MKCFHCDSCDLMVFFENDRCLQCGHTLGFLPDVLDLSAIEMTPDGKGRPTAAKISGHAYHQCENGKQHHVCNWMIPDNDPNPLCPACRLNEVIPNLTDTKNVERWSKLELAKRRCVYTFLKLGLPLEKANDGRQGLSFRFLQDSPSSPVQTGHENGVITVNIAEADEDERERRRLDLHEPYRTLVGHLRHESGHFYWDRLIAGTSNLEPYRKLFGDETLDYDAALKNYYQQGPPAGWQDRTVTAYASSHPWEDWAETWAHYLHITDTLETAGSFGMNLSREKGVKGGSPKVTAEALLEAESNFDDMLARWVPLTRALNSINRGMGLADLYPFVISPAVIEKLRFIHSVIHGAKPPLPTGGQPKAASNPQLAAA
ncbi:MAG TPA: putative zinc-binding metallopeptidase [Verrucomicrobiae bacterium]|nr:putative zinc-binding metallopeptidase [Verrucomicrobiae bacterium]